MKIELITLQDLQTLREQIVDDLKPLLIDKAPSRNQWLKGSEVREMLKISAGTLQNLRVNGSLKPNKIGGSFYYRLSDIENMLNRK